jgi:site-specific DNA-methyltransferase (cytosine-N4-specific)
MPFGKQFSPRQVSLAQVLEIAHAFGGDCVAFQAKVLERYFAGRPTSREKLAMNTRIAMQQYGLLEDDCRLTDVGKRLYGLREDSMALHEEFARHILLRLHGSQLVQAVQVLSARGAPLTARTIAEQLEIMGVDAGGRSGEKLHPMRLWLERAGVFRRDWALDTAAFERLLGIAAETVDTLAGLTPDQRAFIGALVSLPDPTESRSSADVARLAERQSAVRYDVKQLPKKVLFPLKEAGLVEVTKTTGGRGAKPYMVRASDKLVAEVILPLLESLKQTAGPLDPRVLRRPVSELLSEVRDKQLSADRRGKALEGVALQLTRALGLRFIDWRRRAHETGGAEVDVIAIQTNGRFAIWQIQCKVGAIRSRDVVDREVGVAQSLKSDVIAFVTAEDVGRAARDAAEGHMRATGTNIVFLDKSDLDAFAGGASPVGSVDREFNRVREVRSPEST